MRGFAPVCFKNFRVQVVMLVMLVKPADISSLECVSTYFPTGLRTFFRLLQSSESCRTSCTSDCFQILDSAATKIPSEAQRIYVHKMRETRPQPAGETHKPDSLPVSS